MLHGWKARIHHLSRNKVFLIRTSLMVLVAGLCIGCLAQWLRSAVEPASRHAAGLSPRVERYRDTWRKLENARDPAPRELLKWLRHFLTQREELAEELNATQPGIGAFLKDGTLLGFDVRTMINKHAQPGMGREWFSDFIVADLAEDDDRGKAALERIKQVAEQKPAGPFANEMLAHLWLEHHQESDALAAFVREGGFSDAKAARESALRLAIELKEADLLRDLMQRPMWAGDANSWMRSRIGGITGDFWMQLKGIVGHQIETLRWGVIALTFFATGLWYIIFTQHSDKEPWRWARPIFPVIAGVFSIWPTLIILAYQEHHLGMTGDAGFPHDLWYYLAGVGLREELSKLALFAFFLPYLLWRRRSGPALLAGAFVGLGFALEENIQYYGEGGGIAWTRFVTANFMHASMTGIAGHALYEMLRTRFGHAGQFVVTFLTIVAAHGLYDYAAVSAHEMGQLLGISFFSIIILALLARHFFDLLVIHTRVSTGIVSSAAVFLIGSALLIAILFVVAGVTTDDISGIAAVGSECVGVAPIAYIFWKKFEVR